MIKKLFLISFLILLLAGNCFAETLVDSYSETNQDSGPRLSSEGYSIVSQSFTATAGDLSSCRFYLKKYGGSPTGNAVAKLYAHSGTYGTSSRPSGSALATSDNFDVSTLTTSFQLITFTFTGAQQYAMTEGTYYCITIEYSGGDGSNDIQAGSDASTPTHGGNHAGYYSDLTWYDYAGTDICFYVYKVSVAAAPSGQVIWIE